MLFPDAHTNLYQENLTIPLWTNYFPVFFQHRRALYINNKFSEYCKSEAFNRQSIDTQSVLLELNIVDDYFKAKKQISLLEEALAEKEQELTNLKHDLIALQMRAENK